MNPGEFSLERYFARWEFSARHLLCASDIQGMPMGELLALATPRTRTRFETLTLGYTEAPGLPALREAIASLYETIGPDAVLTFAGAEEAIFAAMNVLAGPGDHVAATWPAYQSLHDIARASGAEVTRLSLREELGWTLDLDEVEKALRPATKLLVVNFPHNPTGALPPRAVFDELVALARKRGIHLFSDEVYRLLEHDEKDRLPAAVDVYEKGISLGVMSKAFGLAGLRIGWIATKDAALRAKLAAYKDWLSICNAAPSEVLALAAIEAKEKVVGRARGIVRENLVRLDAFFKKHAGAISWVRPRAGCIGFARVEGDADELAESLVREEGVLLLPASRFGVETPHVRIGFGRTDLPQALEKFDAFLSRRSR